MLEPMSDGVRVIFDILLFLSYSPYFFDQILSWSYFGGAAR